MFVRNSDYVLHVLESALSQCRQNKYDDGKRQSIDLTALQKVYEEREVVTVVWITCKYDLSDALNKSSVTSSSSTVM